MSGYLVSLYCETNTHAGSDASVGTVDLPIQRNEVTGHPEFHDSTVKGALKRHVAAADPDLARRAFGGDPRDVDEPGLVHAGTAQLLLLPLPAGKDAFWWFTTPLLLAKAAQLAAVVGATSPPPVTVTDGDGSATAADPGFIAHDALLDLRADAAVGAVAAWCRSLLPTIEPYEHFRGRLGDAPKLGVLSDEVFRLLCTTASIVQPRNQLDDNKVSQNLWYTEFLPSETLMLTKLTGEPDLARDVAAVLRERPLLQLGGLAGLGAGRLRVTVVEGGDER